LNFVKGKGRFFGAVLRFLRIRERRQGTVRRQRTVPMTLRYENRK
jgi:hypothetical protein